MESSSLDRRSKRVRAKKRIEQLKGFYIHLAVFVIVNIMVITGAVVGNMGNGESFVEAFFNFGTFSTFFFWGIGVVFHGVKVFSYNPFFSKAWEERQIQKYMDADRDEMKKYS
ncbi:2TM domain-containing protein [Zobellia uliginosa]|uniref:2TM domain-containing protein n=1 Tax=Zobellia uliginosa TaxID=143224 RepID=A0ABY1KQ10_9FLAO|nr:2TM domain-containing protein [Zobellia uliginosa]SIS63705.1 2TM domain-containing protein [Zobellia uliginosa]